MVGVRSKHFGLYPAAVALQWAIAAKVQVIYIKVPH